MITEKNLKWFGFLGGLCFVLAFLANSYFSFIGIGVGIFMIVKGSEVPRAKKLGIGVIVMNCIPFLLLILSLIGLGILAFI